MSTKMQLIKVDPERVDFPMLEKEPSVTLKIENTSDKLVAFKVKTTHPKRYLVRPNQDVVPVGAVSSVKISLQIRDAKQLRQERITGVQDLDLDCKDNKFLVQCAVVREPFLDRAQSLLDGGADAKELGGVLKDLWAEMTKDEFVNRKLTCSFNYPRDVGALMEVNNLQSADLQGAGHVPFAIEVGGGAAAGADGAGSASGSATDDLAALRKKYNELINFTVQLTAERDRYKASLKDATKEVVSLRKGQPGAAGRGEGAKEEARAAGSQDAVVGGGGAFSLWQIMLVAVLAFLLGRLLIN